MTTAAVDSPWNVVVGVSNDHPLSVTPNPSAYHVCTQEAVSVDGRMSANCAGRIARYVVVQNQSVALARLGLCEVEVLSSTGWFDRPLRSLSCFTR